MKSAITRESKVTWIGMGTMGSAMAGNLARAGFNVTIWNRTMSNHGVKHAASQGCSVAPSLSNALKERQLICTCVTDGAALKSILFESGLELKSLAARNAVVADFSTIGPVEAQEINRLLDAKGLRFVDAPVTGGDIGARAGTLTFMVGASPADLEFIRPALEVMGKKIVHAGGVGSGQSLKLINQLLCGVNLLAVTEALRAADQLGMDKSLVVEACGGGAAGSWQLVNLGPKIIAQDFQPGFKAAHLLKDLKLLHEALTGPTGKKVPPCFAIAREAFERATRAGHGELGTQAVWKDVGMR